MLSPVSLGTGGINITTNANRSPSMPSVKIREDSGNAPARALGDLFNLQSVNALPNSNAIASNGTVGNSAVTNNGQNNSDFANLLSTLQASGL